MIKFRFFFFLFFSFTFLLSCARLIEDDFPAFDNTIVINNILVEGEAISLNLSKTASVSAKSVQFVENATISLAIDGVYQGDLNYNELGNYYSAVEAEGGKKYDFTVQLPTGKTFTVEQELPIKKQFISLKHIEQAHVNEEGVVEPSILMQISNDFPANNYFQVLIWLKTFEGMVNAELLNTDDIILLNEGTPLAVFSNQLAASDTLALRLNYTTNSTSRFNDGPVQARLYPMVIELRTCNKAYYEFVKQNYFYELSRYPDITGGNQAAISNYANIFGEGITGIAAGYSSIVSDTIFPSNYSNGNK